MKHRSGVVNGLLAFAVLGACSVPRPDHELPMYGGTEPPAVERDVARSQQEAELGWQAYYAGDPVRAMVHFNKAWSLDRDSVQALWGFGLVMGERAPEGDQIHHLRQSVRFLDMAYAAAPHNARLATDLGHACTLLGGFMQHTGVVGFERMFTRGRELLARALSLDPSYVLAIGNQSVLEFYAGDYRAAKRYLDEAIARGYQPEPEFVRDLESRL